MMHFQNTKPNTIHLQNKLQVEAHKITRQLSSALNKQCPDLMRVAQGVGQGYLMARKALLPTISSDGYMKEIEGKVRKIERLLENKEDDKN